MDERPSGLSNGQVIALGGAAAALVAGVVALLGRKEERPVPAPNEPQSARAAADRPPEEVVELIAEPGRRGAGAGRRWWRRASETDVPAPTEPAATADASQSVAGRLRRVRARRSVGDVAGVASERVAQGGHGMTEKVSGTAQKVSDQAMAAAHAIVEQAAAAAVAGKERARGVGASLAGSAKERAPQVGQVSQQVTHKVSEDVVPSLRDIALQAASAALDLWQSARERATDAVETAQHDLAPQAAHAVAAGGERAKGASAAVAEKAGEVGDRAREASEAVAEKAGEVGERAKDASRRAAEATVETTKDTGAMLFWAGAAAGIVFYALLSHERREQLTRTAETVVTQIRELIKDFQGYDEEF